MRRRILLLGTLVLLMLVMTVPLAHAQGWDGDKFVFNEDYVLRADDVLSGNLAVAGGSATLTAGSIVNGDVAVLGGRLVVAGTIRGSVAVFGGTAELTDTAIIEGDLASFGAQVTRAPGAIVRGERFSGFTGPGAPAKPIEVPPMDASQPPSLLRRYVAWQAGTLGLMLLLVLLGVLAVLIAPTVVERVASAAAAQPAFSFGLGLLTLVLGILAGALLLIACGLGLLVWLALLLALVVGWIAMGLWLGQRLLLALKVRQASALAEVVIGISLITVLSRFPFLCIGSLFGVVVASMGLGAVVQTRFGTQGAPIRENPAAETSPVVHLSGIEAGNAPPDLPVTDAVDDTVPPSAGPTNV